MKIPVTIIGGFLGAGKTTLLNRILNADSGMKVAVMVNDFGELNIDSELIVTAQQNMISLANGCICCTVESDLIQQLQNLLNLGENAPEYILIETSGVSEPSRVIHTIGYPQFKGRLIIDSTIVMLDSDQFEGLSIEMKELAFSQLSAADIVVFNKVDLVSNEKLRRLKEKWLFPRSRSFDTSFANVPMALLFGGDRLPANNLSNSTKQKVSHNHKEQFFTNSWQSDQVLSLSKLKSALKSLPQSIYRAKGIVYIKEAKNTQCIVHLVGTRLDITLGKEWLDSQPKSRLVFIGSKEIDQVYLSDILSSCIDIGMNV